jgi:flagellar basal body-associated protein FliL
MPSLDNPSPTDREAYRLGSVKIALVQALVLLALSGAFIFYVNWSSEAARADFMGTSKPSVTESKPHAQSSVQTAKGPKACRLKQTGWRAAYSETV